MCINSVTQLLAIHIPPLKNLTSYGVAADLQAQAYASLNAFAAPTTDTVVIFTGVDEYYQQAGLGNGTPNTTDVISAISTALSTAYSAGARE